MTTRCGLTDQEWEDFGECRAWWTQALGTLLGWPEADVCQWSQRWEDAFRSGTSDFGWFMHETPAYHIAHLFVTSRVKGSLVAGAKSVPQFVGEFTGAIEQGESLGAYIKPDYDWQAARKRVEDLLAQHGETLDGVKAYAEGKKKQ